jgi:hypothetical protein
MILYDTPLEFIPGQVLMPVSVGMAPGLQGAMVVEIFPLRARVTSMRFACSVTLALTGGIPLLVSIRLIERLHQTPAPAHRIIAPGILGIAVMLPMSKTNKGVLDEQPRCDPPLTYAGNAARRCLSLHVCFAGPIQLCPPLDFG